MSSPAINNAAKQRGRPFRHGSVANPRGRPKGSRNKATLAIEALLEGEAEALTRKAIELALSGDIVALRLCLDRVAPTRKERAIYFDMPAILSASDLPIATSALLRAASAGDLTPSEARELGSLVDTHIKALQVADLNARLEFLESKAR
ncbi:DUF5681 domain-containing protein [Bosea thiooxidans]|uniref:DUF5681 domain-containing protein n=1 Tax=Bosea thiooxidans TaxID=53254 RepID=UPI0009E990D7|nr:DUF5681 domain-containing protein [Bosea thiooxidans]